MASQAAIVAQSPASATAALAGMSASMGRVTAIQGALSLPWQTVFAGEAPDVRTLVATGTPLVQRAAGASLRRPAIALLVTTALDIAVALVAGQDAGLQLLVFRAILGGATGAVGLAAGNKPGPLRQVAGVLSMVTSAVQAGSMVLMLVKGPDSGSAVVLLPGFVAQASSLTLAIKTAALSFRR